MDGLPPQFIEIVETVRDLYVDRFAGVVSGLLEDTHVVEPVLIDAQGITVGDGALDLPVRMDFVAMATGQRTMISSDKRVGFEPFSFSLENTAFAVSPFSWDAVSVRVTGEWDEDAASVFKAWFLDAFGKDDAAGNLDLQNVIHFASDPRPGDGAYEFEVDFGTALPSALYDLLTAMSAKRPEAISIWTDYN